MPYIGNITSDFSIDTGNITNRAVTATKLSPSSVGSNGQVLSVDGSGNLQWGNDANAPEGTAVLSTGESGTTKYLRVDGDGTCSWQVPPNTQLSFSNDANNRVVTGTGSGLNGEANLTFNNSVLSIINTSNLGDSFLYIKAGEAGASVIELQADEADDDNDLWRIQNAGDSKLGFRNKTSGSWVEKLGITADGHVGIGVTPSAWPTNADSIALQIGTGFAAFGRGSGDEDRGGIAVNYYTNGTENKYIANGHSNRVYMNDGNIDFQWAPSGNAGNDITFTSGIRMKADGKVGIGTTSPSQELTVYGSDPIISVQEASVSSQVDIGTGTSTGFINIQKADGTRTVQLSGSTDSYFTGGNVGIGETSPDCILHVNAGSADDALKLESTDNAVNLILTDAACYSSIQQNNDMLNINSDPGSTVSASTIRFNIDGVNVGTFLNNQFRLGSNSAGIQFNGDTAAANSLDDYEHGNWVPTSVQGGWTVSSNYSKYVKIGNLVHLQMYISLSGTGNSNDLQFGAMPFAVGGNGYSVGTVDFGEGGIKGTYMRTMSGASTLSFLYPSENTSNARLNLAANQVGDSYVIATISYVIDGT